MNKIITLLVCMFPYFGVSQNATAVLLQMKSHALHEKTAAARLLGAEQNTLKQSGSSNNYDVKYYNCTWEIDPAINYIKGKILIRYAVTKNTNTITLDLSKALTVDSVVYNAVKIAFTHTTNNTLTITYPTIQLTSAMEAVTIYYKGAPVSSGIGSFSTDVHSGIPVMWTLSEPYGSRDWWPCKDILNDKADSVDITLICPAAYRNSSIGTITSDAIVGTKRITQFKHRYPITSYLVAFACTNYVVSSQPYTYGGVTMPLETWAYPESVGFFAGEQYGVTKALDWFGEHFGPYPFMKEKYAQTQFNFGGGQEHQTNSFVLGPYHLLQAHELAHQWFGDKTTCGSWQDIWVNEGFASFSHWFYFETHDVPTYYGIRNEYHGDVTSDSTGSVYVPDTTNVDRIFDYRLSYLKGAYVLHMLRGMLGDAMFFTCIKNYGNDAATKFGYAKTGDVQRVFEQTSGKNLNEFFKDWIYGEGYPIYNVQWYNNKNGYLNIKVNQSQSHPSVSFYEMPLRVKFKNATQDSTIVLDVQQNGQLFATKLNFVPDTVLIDPEYWLLSKGNTQQKLTVPTANDYIQITPNPAGSSNWTITIKNPSQANYSYTLINNLGQTLYQSSLTTNGGDVSKQIPNTQLPNGTYTIVIYQNKQRVLAQKIVK